MQSANNHKIHSHHYNNEESKTNLNKSNEMGLFGTLNDVSMAISVLVMTIFSAAASAVILASPIIALGAYARKVFTVSSTAGNVGFYSLVGFTVALFAKAIFELLKEAIVNAKLRSMNA